MTSVSSPSVVKSVRIERVLQCTWVRATWPEYNGPEHACANKTSHGEDTANIEKFPLLNDVAGRQAC